MAYACVLALAGTVLPTLLCSDLSEVRASSKNQSKNKTLAFDWRTLVVDGDKLLDLGSLQEAEECFRQALLAVNKQSGKAEDIAICQGRLAYTLCREDITEDGIPLYKKAIKNQSRAFGKTDARLLDDLLAAALVLEMDGEYKKARKTIDRAIDIARRHLPEASTKLALALHQSGRIAFRYDDRALATNHFDQALDQYMSQEALTRDQYDDLIDLISDRTDLALRAEIPRKILASSFNKELLKDDLAKMQRSDKIANTKTRGVDFYERMIAIDIKSLGPDHPSVARDLKGLAAIYIGQSKYDQALPPLQRARQIYASTYGADDAATASLQQIIDMVEATSAQNLTNKANPLDLTRPDSQWPSLPRNAKTLDLAQHLIDYAFISYCQGRLPEASRAYAWAVVALDASIGQDNLLFASCLKDYKKVLLGLGYRPDDRRLSEISAASHTIITDVAGRRLLFNK